MGRFLTSVLVYILLAYIVLQAPGYQFTSSHMDNDDIAATDSLPMEEVFEKAQKLMHGQFYENKGQIQNDEVMFYGNIPGGMIGFAESKIYLWMEGANDHVVLFFEGAMSIMPRGIGVLGHQTNYFLGDRGTYIDIKGFTQIAYDNLWPGIDLVYRATPDGAKYEFHVSPIAEPAEITVRCAGQDILNIEMDSVRFKKDNGVFVDEGLVAFQGERLIEAEFVRRGRNAFGIKVGDYDRSKTLVIDPLLYSTFVGGSENEQPLGIAVDSSGNVYVTGYTNSADFPTVSAYDSSYNGAGPGGYGDCFVFKLNASGNGLVYATYVGGGLNEGGNSIAVDSLYNVYVTGWTQSIFGERSEIGNPESGENAVMVFKLNATGNGLDYLTLIGGSGIDIGSSVTIDHSGNAYVTGRTSSTNFPTVNSFDSSHNGGVYDTFMLKLNAAGNALLYSTFIGGEGDDRGHAIALDSSLNAYVAGRTASYLFPTVNSYNDSYNGGQSDCFVLKLNSTGNGLSYSTFVGGSNSDTAESIDVDSLGNAYVAGNTWSADFPMVNAFDSTLNGMDNFVLKLNTTGNGLDYSTYIGGSDSEDYSAIAVDLQGSAYVTGMTDSTDFPVVNAYDSSLNGNRDVYVLKLNSSGNGLLYSTFVGGIQGGGQWGRCIVLDIFGNAFVAGVTTAPDFPTVNAYDSTYNGPNDCFVFKLPDMGDSDGDTLTDYEENQLGTDRFDNDTDNDGLDDGSEVNVHFTDPNNNDTDSDSMVDGWEVQYALNPLFDDSMDDPDTDSLANLDEYQHGTDPGNNDTDSDNFLDGWEVANGYDPLDPYSPDVALPEVSHPPAFSYEQGSTGNEILWMLSDRNPYQFQVVGNGSTVGWTSWTNGSYSINVDGLTPGVYNHTIVVTDTFGNVAVYTVFVTVVDTTPPQLEPPLDMVYEEGATGNQLVWIAGDLNPFEYAVTGNATVIDWTPWTNGSITVDVDGLTPGVYNYTIVVKDNYANWVSDTVTVTVVDTILPEVNNPDDFTYEQGTSGNEIVWTVGDRNPGVYRLVGNGTTIDWTPWTNGSITVDVDGLTPGVYNHTIIIHDEFGGSVSDTVLVTVHDTTPPSVDPVPDLTAEQGRSVENVSWIVADLNSSHYEVRIDGSVDTTAQWDGSDIVFSLENLVLGIHTVTVYVFDIYGNSASDSVLVTIVDTTSPTVSSPVDVLYEYGTTGHSMVWQAYDLNPSHYDVIRNGVLVASVGWSGGGITYQIDELDVGNYNMTILVYDSSGNSNSDTVIVTVISTTTTPTTTTTTTETMLPDNTMLIVFGGVGVAIVAVLIVVMRFRKK